MPWLMHGDHPMEVNTTHNGVCRVLHGVCCGWGQVFSPDEQTFDTPDQAILNSDSQIGNDNG